MNERTKQLNSLQIQIDELKNKISFFTQQLKNVAKSMATIAQNFNYERESLAFDNKKTYKLSAEKLRALADIPVLDFVSDHFEDTPKPITIDGVQYNLVPVPSTQEVVPFAKEAQQAGKFFETKSQTKYRKNGALVFAPKIEMDYWSIESDGRVEKGNWILNFPYNKLKLQQGLIFDNEQACQFWADKLKIAYELKQRIVESESQANGDLGQCYVSTNDKRKVWTLDSFAGFPKQLLVSTIAKDILMSKDVSDEDFKAFIEVFSF